MERAAYYKEYADKKLRGLLHTGSGAPGNAATRIDSYAVTGGSYVYTPTRRSTACSRNR